MLITANNSSVDVDNVLAVTMSSSSDDWMLASRCSYHVTPNGDFFTAYKYMKSGKVLKMHDGEVRILTNIRHVLDLRKNLITLSVLD